MDKIEVDLLIDKNKRLKFFVFQGGYLHQFAERFEKCGLTLQEISEISHIPLEQLIGYFQNNNLPNPAEHAAILAASRWY